MWSGPRLALTRRRGPLLGAGSSLPFPLHPASVPTEPDAGAGVSARGPTYVTGSLAGVYVATYGRLSPADDFPDSGPMKSGRLGNLP